MILRMMRASVGAPGRYCVRTNCVKVRSRKSVGHQEKCSISLCSNPGVGRNRLRLAGIAGFHADSPGSDEAPTKVADVLLTDIRLIWQTLCIFQTELSVEQPLRHPPDDRCGRLVPGSACTY